jgi:hypothetical protein
MALSCFTTNTWKFTNDKLKGMRTNMPPGDKKDFSLDFLDHIDLKDIFRDAIVGSRKYLLKEHANTLSDARKHYRR